MKKTLIIVAALFLCVWGKNFSADTLISPELKSLIDKAPSAVQFPNASFYVLLDSTHITKLNTGGYEIRRHYIAKALTYRGKKSLSNFKIAYNPNFEKVEILNARTINPSRVDPVDSTEMNEINPPEYSEATVYAKITQLVLTMPSFAESSIMEIEYRLFTTQKPPVPFGGMKVMVGEEPAAKVCLYVGAENGEKVYYLQAGKIAEPRTDKGIKIWSIENYAGTQLEAGTPPMREVLPTVYYTSSRTWGEEAEQISSLIYPTLLPNAKIQTLGDSLCAGKKGREAIAAFLFYVQDKFKKIYADPNMFGFRGNEAGKVLENGYGDSRDLSALLIALLKTQKIEAYPVLVSSGGAAIKELPVTAQFNGFIVAAETGQEMIYCDPMEEYAAPGFVGAVNGEMGFLVRPGKSALVEIPRTNPLENSAKYLFQLELAPSGAVSGSVNCTFAGEGAMQIRDIFRHAKKSKIKQNFQKAASNIIDGAKLKGEPTLSGIEENTGTANVKIGFTAENFMTLQGNMGILWLPKLPFDVVGLPDISQEKREYPLYIDIPVHFERSLAVTLPQGYSVVYVPPATHLEDELGAIDISSKTDGNKLDLTVSVVLKQKRISTADYDRLKNLIKTVTAKKYKIILLEAKS